MTLDDISLLEEGTIEHYLAAHVLIRKKGNLFNPDWRYSCPEEFVLKHGHRFSGDRCFDVKAGKPKMCFNNAFSLSQSTGLYYCEGWAAGVIPVHHAWCCDNDGVIYDPTWVLDEHQLSYKDYIGVIFDLVTVARSALLTHRPGIFYHDDRLSEQLVTGQLDAGVIKL